MKDMCPISVNINTFYLLTVDIAANVITLINDKTTLALVRCQACKCRPEKTGSYNQIIILLIVHLACHF